MVSFKNKIYTKSEINQIFSKEIKKWFFSKYDSYTEIQKRSLINIRSRKDSLIISPTGSGKTLAVFLSILDELISLQRKSKLEDKIYALYVSPLRALNYDIQKNLIKPLNEIQDMFDFEEKIRIKTRTGDSTSYEKSKQLKKPPHILITTPESFAISMGAKKFRHVYNEIEWFILDEIHSLVSNKRGALVISMLEYLDYISDSYFARIGVSATVSPEKEVAKFLIGNNRNECDIIKSTNVGNYDLKIKSNTFFSMEDDVDYDISYNDYLKNYFKHFSQTESEEICEKINNNTINEIEGLVLDHKSTLIFTNTRVGAEKIAYQLKERDINAMVHHSSLSYDVRTDVENKLKEGRAKCVVTSTSLELGIDFTVDLVILLGSPRSVTRASQRIGRSNHNPKKEIQKGVFIPLTRDDFVECFVIKNALEFGFIDDLNVIESPYDVFIQVLFIILMNESYSLNEIHKIFSRVHVFSDLSKLGIKRILKFINENYFKFFRLGKKDGSYFISGKLKRPMILQNISVIDFYPMLTVIENNKPIGKVPQDFYQKLQKRDKFVINANPYLFLGSKNNAMFVKRSKSSSNIASWHSEELPLNYNLARIINRLRKIVFLYLNDSSDKFNDKSLYDVLDNLSNEVHSLFNKIKFEKFDSLNLNSGSNINILQSTSEENISENNLDELLMLFDYLFEQKSFFNFIENKIYVEFYNPANTYIFHTLLGRRANEALSHLIVFHFLGKSSRNSDVSIKVHNNGFAISGINFNEKKVLNFLNHFSKSTTETDKESTVEKIYSLFKEEMINTKMFKRRFSKVIERFLLILRSQKKKKELKDIIITTNWFFKKFKDSDNVLVRETLREILEDKMDLKNMLDYLYTVNSCEIKSFSVLSPFSLEIFFSDKIDVVYTKSRVEFLKEVYSKIVNKVILDNTK
ncbi:MAG: DEAD/DEAH box helicase [Candidatus Woesearchaeota archaeon]